MPISKELFADLLVYLDGLKIGQVCDGISLKHTEDFLRRRGLQEETVQDFADFCNKNGGWCDCEISWNVSPVVFQTHNEAFEYYSKAKSRLSNSVVTTTPICRKTHRNILAPIPDMPVYDKRKNKPEWKLAEMPAPKVPVFVRVLIAEEKYLLKFAILKHYYQTLKLNGLDALEMALSQDKKTVLTVDEDGEKFIVATGEIGSDIIPKQPLPLIPVNFYSWNTMLLPSVPTHLKLRVAKVFNYDGHKEPVFIVIDRKTHLISSFFKDNVYATYEDAVDAIIRYTQEYVAKKYCK